MKYEQPSGKLLDICIENILFTTTTATTATTKTPNKKTLKKPLPNRKTFPFFYSVILNSIFRGGGWFSVISKRFFLIFKLF